MYLHNISKFFHQLFTFGNLKIYTKEFIFSVCIHSKDLTLVAQHDVSVNNDFSNFNIVKISEV